MGRYTTVQTYSDSNPMVVKVPYETAAGAGGTKEAMKNDFANEKGGHGAGYTVEKVNNVMGSTAGAGSGDFHHYRHTRRREILRVEAMEKDAVRTEQEAEFDAQREAGRRECEERTRRNAEKRRRKKQKRQQATAGAADEGAAAMPPPPVPAFNKFGGGKRKLDNGPRAEEEFSYTPLFSDASSAASAPPAAKKGKHAAAAPAPAPAPEQAARKEVAQSIVANDGSFMERMRALKQAKEGAST